jgi:hypothetical protein
MVLAPTIDLGQTFWVDHSSGDLGWLVLSGSNFDDGTSTSGDPPSDIKIEVEKPAGATLAPVSGTLNVFLEGTWIRVQVQYTPPPPPSPGPAKQMGSAQRIPYGEGAESLHFFDALGGIFVTISNSDASGTTKRPSPRTSVNMVLLNT